MKKLNKEQLKHLVTIFLVSIIFSLGVFAGIFYVSELKNQ